jgi:dihydrofolate reductase
LGFSFSEKDSLRLSILPGRDDYTVPRIQSFNCHRRRIPTSRKGSEKRGTRRDPKPVLGDAMRNIRIIEHISLDGVIQGGGGPKEDTSGGFAYGGWTVPHHDPDAGAAIVAAHGEAFDLLLGRRTYDIWSGFWPKAPKSPMADSINAATKYVATHRPKSLEWGPVEDLGSDIVEGVRQIKAKNGPHLIVWGSSTLTPVLLEHELADEVLLLVFPVLLGTGKRLFSEGTPPRELALVSTKAVSSGVIISSYRPSGPLRTGAFGDAK